MTNTSGAVTDTYSYTAFGELFNQTGSTTNSYLYTGQQFDSLTGLYDLRARYYNPALGKFLSQDTYPVNFNNPVELNRYVYTGNNPVNRIDPTGNDFIEYLEILAGRAGVATTTAYLVVRASSMLMYYAAQLAPYNADEINEFISIVQYSTMLGGEILSWAQSLPQLLTQPGAQAQTSPVQTQTQSTEKSDKSFDIAFGRQDNLGLFAFALSTKYKRTVVPWNEWDKYSLSPTAPDTSLPTGNATIARRYIGGAETWSSRFPEAQYPEAKIRFNLWKVELGSSPRITLWEYYFLKQNPMLWSRAVFYDWESSGFSDNPFDPSVFPIPLQGGLLSSRLLQIENSQNYRKIQALMGTNAP